MMLCWPLLLRVDARTTRVDPPFLFLALLPVVIAVVLAEISEGGMDSRVLAILGVLSAVNAILRGVSAGTGGCGAGVLPADPGRPGLRARLRLRARLHLAVRVRADDRRRRTRGCRTRCSCAAWVGMGAGLLPRRVTGKREIAMLAVYGVFAAYAFGLLMNLSGWPFLLGIEVPGHEGSLSYVAGAPVLDNLHRFLVYTLLTSTGSLDTGRAITNAVALVVLGPAVLTTLRRASRRVTVVAHPTSTGAATDAVSS